MTTDVTTPSTATRTHQLIFLNMPVADTIRSREFFTSLGYGFDENLCSGQGLALELGPNHYAMLLQADYFASFHGGRAAEPDQHEVLTCLSADSRADVDDLVDRAVAAGGLDVRTDQMGDFMYGRSYTDLDGHVWEIMWMDVEAATVAGTFG